MQRIIIVLSLILASCIAIESVRDVPDGYVPTPDGLLLHSSCIHTVPNAQHVDVEALPVCGYPAKRLLREQIYAMDIHEVATNATRGFYDFNSTWNVPELPKKDISQVLYFWPGFKSEKPEMGYPVLQPVLQYGQHGNHWELQSWFVWGNKNTAVNSNIVPVNPGDKIYSYMHYNDRTATWTVYGEVIGNHETAVLNVAKAKAGNCAYEWAMLVFETIIWSDNCAYYPSSPSVMFTDNSLDNLEPAKWTVRTNKQQCGQTIHVSDDQSVAEFTWHN